MAPPFSAMKSRGSPGGAVRYSGKLRPAATSCRATGTGPSGGGGSDGPPELPASQDARTSRPRSEVSVIVRLIQVPHAIGWLVTLLACTPVGVWIYEDPRVTVSRVRLDADPASESPVL